MNPNQTNITSTISQQVIQLIEKQKLTNLYTQKNWLIQNLIITSIITLSSMIVSSFTERSVWSDSGPP